MNCARVDNGPVLEVTPCNDQKLVWQITTTIHQTEQSTRLMEISFCPSLNEISLS